MEPDGLTRARASFDPGDPLVGRTLDGRYQIEQRVARGGMATVYRAHDTRLDRTVAIKVMHTGMGDDDAFAERFVREARAAAKLSHPNVVAVHDQGEDDGTVFLAMEYVPGRTLRDVIREEAPLAPARALEMLEPVLAALAAAHRSGLVHRDVKPENVLITDPGPGELARVKVADFGLARAVNATSTHTATGVVIGSVSYLAPELVVQGRTDERVDVYAAGVVLYELLTGEKPHDAESQIQVAYKHVHEDVPAPSQVVPAIPAYVDALVARATAREADQRPADASVLLHHLRRVAAALREGLANDPELEADLRPRTIAAPLDVEIQADADGIPDVERGTPAGDELLALAFDDAGEQTSVRGTPVVEPVVPVAPVEHTQQIDASTFQSTPPAPPKTVRTRAAKGVRRLPAPEADIPGARQGPARRRRGPILLALALLLVIAVGASAWWFGFARYTSMPSVLEMSESEAVKTLEAADLTTDLGEPRHHEEIAKGMVVSTDPGPGDRVLSGDTVQLFLSLGPERYDVPKLRGQSVDEATESLAELKLELGRTVEKWHEKIPEGQVLSTNPGAGTTLKPGAAVNITVSRGRKPIEVTDWTGKNADRARSTLSEAGLEVKVDEVFDDEVSAGRVMGQDPAEATLYKGDTVTLTVSKGPELVEVPNVRSQGVDEATKRLEALGFKVETKRATLHLGLGFVAGSDPSPGTMVPKGSTITLSLV